MEEGLTQDFARAFGDALLKFMQEKGLSASEASRQLELGPSGKARISTYLHDSSQGRRAKPDAEVLYRVCVRLGFEFDYNGYRISAASLNGNHAAVRDKPAEQLSLEFNGQFDLTEERGTISVSVKRPPGRIEVTMSLKAAS